MIREELKAALDAARERFGIPSYSATCYYKGETFSFSSGVSSVESGEEVNEDTLYAIGSCTKSFVAGALCALADRGLLTLDDKVKDYIPELEMMDSYASLNLTIRDMLCHRCGLPRHELSWYSRLADLTDEDIVSMFRYMEPNEPFRYTWQYNNQMYAMAGLVIRRITGKDWQDVVSEYLLAPLGITRVAFDPEEAMAMGNCATPHSRFSGEEAIHTVPHANIGVMSSAGSIYMSTKDQVKWVTMLMHGGKFNDQQILSEKMAYEMWTPQMLKSDESPAPLKPYIFNHAYGLGLQTETFRGQRLIHHGGHIDGFIANQSFLPEQDFAIAVLTNGDEYRSDDIMRYTSSEYILGGTEDFAAQLQQFYKEQAEAMKSGNDKIWAEKPANMPCPVALSDIAGTYRDNGYGDLVITVDGDLLSVQLGTLTMTGTHYANNFFYLEEKKAMPGLMVEACVDLDIKANVIGFAAAFEPAASKKIYFKRQ